MPSAASKPCRHVGCGQLVGDGTGYCATHQEDRKIGKFADEHRGSRQSRGYGAEWEVTRKRILSRDKGLCQPCLKAKRYRPARQVDHKIPKFEGGTDDDDNLQSICKTCHAEKTQAEALRARRGGGV
jgi:5-methylcytosine-specific restriction protein A